MTLCNTDAPRMYDDGVDGVSGTRLVDTAFRRFRPKTGYTKGRLRYIVAGDMIAGVIDDSICSTPATPETVGTGHIVPASPLISRISCRQWSVGDNAD